jgi:hypothetical protein
MDVIDQARERGFELEERASATRGFGAGCVVTMTGGRVSTNTGRPCHG